MKNTVFALLGIGLLALLPLQQSYAQPFVTAACAIGSTGTGIIVHAESHPGGGIAKVTTTLSDPAGNVVYTENHFYSGPPYPKAIDITKTASDVAGNLLIVEVADKQGKVHATTTAGCV